MACLKTRKFFHKISFPIAKIALFGIFVLFALNCGDVISMAKEGIDLCLFVVIPSLFPFFVLSQLMIKWRLCDNLGDYLTPLARLLFRQRGICFVPFILGITSGYPVGVKSVLTLRQDGLCTEEEANFMLSFCSNCGPAFLVGTVGTVLFGSPRLGWMLYGCHVGAALICGILFSFLPVFSGSVKPSLHHPKKNDAQIPIVSSFLNAVSDSFSLVLGVSAFIIFFCVLIGLLSKLEITSLLSQLLACLFPVISPEAMASVVSGLLEMTRGIQLASLLPNQMMGALCAAFLCAFSGCSIHFQALFLLRDSTLKRWPYFMGKTLHAFLSGFLCFAVFSRFTTAVVLPVSPAPPFLTVPSLYQFTSFLILLFVAGMLLLSGISFLYHRKKA